MCRFLCQLRRLNGSDVPTSFAFVHYMCKYVSVCSAFLAQSILTFIILRFKGPLLERAVLTLITSRFPLACFSSSFKARSLLYLFPRPGFSFSTSFRCFSFSRIFSLFAAFFCFLSLLLSSCDLSVLPFTSPFFLACTHTQHMHTSNSACTHGSTAHAHQTAHVHMDQQHMHIKQHTYTWINSTHTHTHTHSTYIQQRMYTWINSTRTSNSACTHGSTAHTH